MDINNRQIEKYYGFCKGFHRIKLFSYDGVFEGIDTKKVEGLEPKEGLFISLINGKLLVHGPAE